jgi:branched-chain amino acid transport system substrate-binding protein
MLDHSKLSPDAAALAQEFVRRFQAKHRMNDLPTHASMGFNNTWVFLENVLKPTVARTGGMTADALRQSALQVDIPVGGTIQGYGVKFNPPGHPMAGQNSRASPVVMQFVNGRTNIAWPKAIRTVDPVMPFPKGHAFAP